MVKIFNTASWPSTFRGTKELRTWGNEDVIALASYYEENHYITKEEKQLAIQQWPLFRQRVLQRKEGKKDIEIYQEILKENLDDVKGMAVLLTIMLTISSSTAACERGFSCMNSQKTDLRTRLAEESLNDIMFLSVNGPSVDDFDASPHVKSWVNNDHGKGTRHREHKTKENKRKNKDESTSEIKKNKRKCK